MQHNNKSGNNKSGNNKSGNNTSFPSLLAEALEIDLRANTLAGVLDEPALMTMTSADLLCVGEPPKSYTRTAADVRFSQRSSTQGTWEEFVLTVSKPEAKESTWSSSWFTDLTKALWMFENELDISRHGHQKQGLFEALLKKLEELVREANGTEDWCREAEKLALGDRPGCFVKGVTSLVTMVGFLDKAHIEQVDGDVFMLAIPTTHTAFTSVGELPELNKRGLLNKQNNRWVTGVRFEGEGMQGYSACMKPLPTRVCWVKASVKGVFQWHPGPRNMGDVPYVRLGANPGILTVINGRVCVM